MSFQTARPHAHATHAARAVSWHEQQADQIEDHQLAMWHIEAASAILNDRWRALSGAHELDRIARWHEQLADALDEHDLRRTWHMSCARELRELASRISSPAQV